MSKKRSPGEFTPSQFATCIEKGLNIHAHDRLHTASATAVAKSSSKSPNKNDNATTKTKRNNDNPTTTSTKSSIRRVECTNGAMEALRLSHATFLSTLASSLGEESCGSTSASTKPLSEENVVTCLEEMGFSDLAKRGLESLLVHVHGEDDDARRQQKRRQKQSTSQNKRRRKKKKAFAGFEGTEEELIAEQERLLAESARRVQMMKSVGGYDE
eukprot:CAMPEP_0201610752 /NCGR_PEP_ID=MMETSP0492-20130828/17786_1 /ASSEMBLY_ACC=CAM_ASM_000837 /TAXON_ID=420259 /ORGANISM="Thalassiosira gravida, Strain GMp14c1" /LENGTH=213 /DNA_ID=CAMNT_0048076677 /DNA_START=62 /DNA_END=703 /DNA_ORIENTATION=+